MAFLAELAHLADVCTKAQELYERDVIVGGRIAKTWRFASRRTRDVYIDLAVLELEKHRIVQFPQPSRPVPPSELVPHAVRAIESAISDLVNAANAVQSESEAVDLQDVIKDLTVKLNQVSHVAWTRERSFYPKGA